MRPFQGAESGPKLRRGRMGALLAMTSGASPGVLP